MKSFKQYLREIDLNPEEPPFDPTELPGFPYLPYDPMVPPNPYMPAPLPDPSQPNLPTTPEYPDLPEYPNNPYWDPDLFPQWPFPPEYVPSGRLPEPPWIPSRRDSDGDGIPDWDDVDPLDPLNPSLTPTNPLAPEYDEDEDNVIV